jgi:hypothetical protein
MPPALTFTAGQTFGRWTVICYSHTNERGARLWTCKCACGQVAIVRADSLMAGRSLDCRECRRAKQRTHGAFGSRIYRTWNSMITRCHNPRSASYRYYGRLGIQVCPEWRDSFAAFRNAVGEPPSPAHTLERRNPWLGYQPGNVRWATRAEQARNKRNSRRSAEEKRQLGAAWIAEMIIRMHHTGSPLPQIEKAGALT